MSIEERLSNAILDLEGRLAEGCDCELAVRDTAKDYDLKEEVLRQRAIKILGPLEVVKDKIAQRVEAARSENAFLAAIDAYIDEEADVAMREWLEQRLGRAPSYEQLLVAYHRSTERWFIKNAHKIRD